MNKEYKFSGDWVDHIILNKISFLQKESISYFKISEEHIENLKNKLVKIIIEDDITDSPDPTEYQLNAIKYIQLNEDIILQRIFYSVKEQYKVYQELVDYGTDNLDEIFPKLDKIEDLYYAITIDYIEILINYRDSTSFVVFHFFCSWEIEHDCHVLMHKDTILHVGGYGEYNLEDYNPNPICYKEWLRNDNYHLFDKPIYSFPNKKYNKLKPSQINANKYYSNGLIHKNLNKEFIEGIENNLFNINDGLSNSFLAQACARNNKELFDYILSKRPQNTYGAMDNAVYMCNKYFIQELLKFGFDINENGEAINACVRGLLSTQDFSIWKNFEDILVFLFDKGANPYKSNNDGKDTFDYILDYSTYTNGKNRLKVNQLLYNLANKYELSNPK